IVHPDQDLFGFWEFTERVISKLMIVGTTIALQGGFGAGKTSFIHLLERRAELRRQRLYFVRVSCWGFEETVAAQKNLLSSLVRRVNAEVDCLSIRTLPKEYVSIVSKKLEWLNLLTAIDESPVEQLQRLTPILSSIGGQVVVVVEDVDRTGQKFDVSTVFALLAQFREVQCLSFILAISPRQSVDFARLCEFTERLPAPSARTVALICHRTRERLIKNYPDEILVDKLQDLLEATSRNEVITLFTPGVKYWNSALAELLRPPRFLKRTLRRMSDAWTVLHGEVSIDALLMTCALREAAPAAFSFVQSELDGILTAARTKTPKFGTSDAYFDKLRKDLKFRWQLVVDLKEFEPRPVEVLIQNLFPGTSFLSDIETEVTALKQGPSGDRAKLYAMRLFTEEVDVSP
ncbi:MAG TPA: P-loop NTPase fold protein, partial [Pyrinomonadaceae bacterium]|nr:P-loop NTPase fold protein [Pyrinomonadaceae bacterium]